ncbi:hypothetical protein IAT38_006020 [Cryptococcus sp. DSM 104549]
MAGYVPVHDRQPYYTSLPTPPPSHQPPSPRYAPPDLHPTEPYPSSAAGLAMSSQAGHPESGSSTPPPAVSAAYVPRKRIEEAPEEEDSDAGPSRKRARQEEEYGQEYYNGNGGEYEGGYEGYEGQAGPPEVYQHAPPPQPMGLQPSLFNIAPRNPFTAVVGDFIMNASAGQRDVEIEIKLGTFMAPSQGNAPSKRINLPSLSEMIIPNDYPIGNFHSTLHKDHYIHLNSVLNQAVERQASLPRGAGRVGFSRSKLTDSFYNLRGQGKVRVSRDRDTKEVVQVVQKRRIGDLNVYCPGVMYDLRISVNVEEPCDLPPDYEQPTGMRDKDRACYTHQVCRVDLTHVRTGDSHNPNAKPVSSFELEIEVLDVPSLIAEGQQGSERFDDILQNVLDTARMLSKNAV